MAELNGKTATEIAKEIVNEAVTPVTVTISGVRAQELRKLVRSRHASDIEIFGSVSEQKLKSWESEFVEKFVESSFRQQTKTANAKASAAKLEYYNLLVSRGMSKDKALAEAGL